MTYEITEYATPTRMYVWYEAECTGRANGHPCRWFGTDEDREQLARTAQGHIDEEHAPRPPSLTYEIESIRTSQTPQGRFRIETQRGTGAYESHSYGQQEGFERFRTLVRDNLSARVFDGATTTAAAS